jgi:hypothetical protein
VKFPSIVTLDRLYFMAKISLSQILKTKKYSKNLIFVCYRKEPDIFGEIINNAEMKEQGPIHQERVIVRGCLTQTKILENEDDGSCLVDTKNKLKLDEMMKILEVYLNEEHDEQLEELDGLVDSANHPWETSCQY